MLPKIVQDTESSITEWSKDLGTVQAEYLRKHGKYFQSLAVGDMEKLGFIRIQNPPHETYAGHTTVPEVRVIGEISVDEHKKYKQAGYTTVLRVKSGGRIYEKRISYGEVHNGSHGWLDITDEYYGNN